MSPADYYIEHLQLTPHPEGGFFRECFRSEYLLHFPGFDGPRPYSTSIYFLLKKDQQSALHRIKSDEIWYHHDGGALIITEIDEHGHHIETVLGKDISNGENLQHVVKAGRWFGAQLAGDTEFSLVGCQVSPGFDFRDFELKK